MTDKEYFSDCVRQCERSMYTLAYGILRNEADAADAMQDAILKAYCSLAQLKDREKFRPWILSIVHNTALGYIRKRKDTVDLEACGDMAGPEAGVDAAVRLTVGQAVGQLNMPYRAVILLFYYEGYSVEEIARVTRTSAAAVKQQLSRGRKMLAKRLNKEDFVV